MAKVVEGYLYVYPYVEDDVFIHSEKPEKKGMEENMEECFEELSKKHAEGVSLLDILEKFEGKRVRMIIEEKKITVEVLECEALSRGFNASAPRPHSVCIASLEIA